MVSEEGETEVASEAVEVEETEEVLEVVEEEHEVCYISFIFRHLHYLAIPALIFSSKLIHCHRWVWWWSR